jgi:hypothetical protein
MKLRTESGVIVSTEARETGKLVHFSEPVSTIEFTYDEARRLSYALGKEKQEAHDF